MIIVLLGDSGAGKTAIQNRLVQKGFERIISYTTRSPRPDEDEGKDYYFINNETFNELKECNLFAEYDEYTQGRKYGTLKTDYIDDNKVVVLTPNGFRKVKNIGNDEIFSVYIKANLGTRIKRYIDRCGVNKFNFDDANEIFSRVNKDFGMFLGIEKEVDLVVDNSEGTNIDKVVDTIIDYYKRKEINEI